MKLRIAAASLLLVLAAACTSENPAGPQAPSAPVKEAGNWMGSGH